MSKGSPSTIKPIDLVYALNKSFETVDPGKSYITTNDRNQTRFFNEYAKDAGSGLYELFTMDLTQNTKEFQKNFFTKIAKYTIPFDKTATENVEKMLNKLSEDLASDPGWEKFWNNLQRAHADKTTIEINQFKEKMLAAYRFKVLNLIAASVSADPNLTSEMKANILKASKAVDIVSTDIYKNNVREQKYPSVYQYQLEAKSEKLGPSIMMYQKTNMNAVVKNGIKMLKAGKSEDEIKTMLDQERKKILLLLATDPNAKTSVKEAGILGSEKTKQKFNDIFNDDFLLAKIKGYENICQILGFDVEERLIQLDKIIGGKIISSEERNLLNDYVRLLVNAAYIPESQLKSNDDLNKQDTDFKRKHDEMINKITKIRDDALEQRNTVKVEAFAKLVSAVIVKPQNSNSNMPPLRRRADAITKPNESQQNITQSSIPKQTALNEGNPGPVRERRQGRGARELPKPRDTVDQRPPVLGHLNTPQYRQAQSGSAPKELAQNEIMSFADKWLKHIEIKLASKENLNPEDIKHIEAIAEVLQSLKSEGKSDLKNIQANFVFKLADHLNDDDGLEEKAPNANAEYLNMINEITEGKDPPSSEPEKVHSPRF